MTSQWSKAGLCTCVFIWWCVEQSSKLVVHRYIRYEVWKMAAISTLSSDDLKRREDQEKKYTYTSQIPKYLMATVMVVVNAQMLAL